MHSQDCTNSTGGFHSYRLYPLSFNVLPPCVGIWLIEAVCMSGAKDLSGFASLFSCMSSSLLFCFLYFYYLQRCCVCFKPALLYFVFIDHGSVSSSGDDTVVSLFLTEPAIWFVVWFIWWSVLGMAQFEFVLDFLFDFLGFYLILRWAFGFFSCSPLTL